jgi:transcriptional regulator with XRE-family HTH domain
MFMSNDFNSYVNQEQHINEFDANNSLMYGSAMNKLKETIQLELDKRGWNHYDLERHTGVPQPTIYRFLSGITKDMRAASVAKIAAGLGLSEAQLRGLDQIPVNENKEKNHARKLLESLPEIKRLTESDVESYWLDVIIACKNLIKEGLYPDTEESRRNLFHDAFDLMSRYNYPAMKLIDELLRERVKNKKVPEEKL